MWTIPSLVETHGYDPLTKVKCVCGRIVFADTLHDIRPLPQDKRIHSAEFVCAGCVSTMSREGISTREELVTGHNAPAPVIHAAKRHDLDSRHTIKKTHPKHLAFMKKPKGPSYLYRNSKRDSE